jgi:hypothetical protein
VRETPFVLGETLGLFKWLDNAVDTTQSRYVFSLNPVADEHGVAEVERELGVSLPSVFRRFLTDKHDGGIFFHGPSDYFSPTAFHVFGVTPISDEVPLDLLSETLVFRQNYPVNSEHLIVFGYTPGPGAFYLALDVHTGEVLDLDGYRPSDWKVIASGFEELLAKMFSDAANPLYWL